jgi:hypothetical protein
LRSAPDEMIFNSRDPANACGPSLAELQKETSKQIPAFTARSARFADCARREKNARQKLRGRYPRPLWSTLYRPLSASFSSLPFSWLPLVSILPSIHHGKIYNDVLLQLFDCIELMKNEVKKKMNAMERVMVYQSHRKLAHCK